MFKWAKEENKEPQNNEVGLLIHFTPSANYLYISTEGAITSEVDQPIVVLGNEHGDYIEVTGNYVILTVNSENDVRRVINQYCLERMQVPIIRIEVHQEEQEE